MLRQRVRRDPADDCAGVAAVETYMSPGLRGDVVRRAVDLGEREERLRSRKRETYRDHENIRKIGGTIDDISGWVSVYALNGGRWHRISESRSVGTGGENVRRRHARHARRVGVVGPARDSRPRRVLRTRRRWVCPPRVVHRARRERVVLRRRRDGLRGALPGEFRHLDARDLTLEALGLDEPVDLVWLSPPCQAYARPSHVHYDDPKAVFPTFEDLGVRDLTRLGREYVIENVVGCDDLRDPVELNGVAFGERYVYRRLFETSFDLPEWSVRADPEQETVPMDSVGEKEYARVKGTHFATEWDKTEIRAAIPESTSRTCCRTARRSRRSRFPAATSSTESAAPAVGTRVSARSGRCVNERSCTHLRVPRRRRRPRCSRSRRADLEDR